MRSISVYYGVISKIIVSVKKQGTVTCSALSNDWGGMYLSFDWLFIVKKREHNGGDRNDKLDIFAHVL